MRPLTGACLLFVVPTWPPFSVTAPELDVEAIARYFGATALELGLLCLTMFGVQSVVIPNVSGALTGETACACLAARRRFSEPLWQGLSTGPLPGAAGDIGRNLVFVMFLVLSVKSRVFNVLGAKRPSVKCGHAQALSFPR